MKKVLIAYDRMMMGGTTTALLALLDSIDYSKYAVDLILYENSGPYIDRIPPNVKILKEAYLRSPIADLGSSKRKIIHSLFNGAFIKSFISYIKYKGSPKGNSRNILAHYSVKAQVSISRPLSQQYDIAIGFIEGWADHYILSSKVKACKRLVWVHPDYQASYLIPEVDRKPFKNANNIVVVSKNCADTLAKVFPEHENKIVVIENITSPRMIIERSNDLEAPVEKTKLNLCTVARCDMDVKGLDRIVSILDRLRKEYLLHDILWHYIGAGKDYDALKKMIVDTGLQDNVVFYGEIKNPLPYLKKMDAFILASRYEGKPVSVTEAQVLGVPCIVTNYASAKEQIRDMEDGIVADNSEDGLYNAIKTWITNPELRHFLKENTLKKDYGTRGIIKKLYKVIGDE